MYILTEKEYNDLLNKKQKADLGEINKLQNSVPRLLMRCQSNGGGEDLTPNLGAVLSLLKNVGKNGTAMPALFKPFAHTTKRNTANE